MLELLEALRAGNVTYTLGKSNSMLNMAKDLQSKYDAAKKIGDVATMGKLGRKISSLRGSGRSLRRAALGEEELKTLKSYDALISETLNLDPTF